MGRRNRLGPPEGMRANAASRRFRRATLMLALLSASVAVAIGGEPASLSVANQTPHVLHVVVAEKTFPSVAPGARATYVASGPATVAVTASYAPGQGVEGTAQRSFHLTPGPGGSASGTTFYFACTTNNSIVSPVDGGPMLWKVTADTLARR